MEQIPQFGVDRKALVGFLARARRRQRRLPDGAPDHEDWTLPAAGPWKPRELDAEQLWRLEHLIPQAAAAGALTCPPGWMIRLVCFDDSDLDGGDAWYEWRLTWSSPPEDGVVSTLGFAVASQSLEYLAVIGQYDAAGHVAAASVIYEARDYGNHLLADFYGLLTSPGRGIRREVLGIHAAQIPPGENQPGDTRV